MDRPLMFVCIYGGYNIQQKRFPEMHVHNLFIFSLLSSSTRFFSGQIFLSIFLLSIFFVAVVVDVLGLDLVLVWQMSSLCQLCLFSSLSVYKSARIIKKMAGVFMCVLYCVSWLDFFSRSSMMMTHTQSFFFCCSRDMCFHKP